MDVFNRRIPVRITPDRLTNAVVKIVVEDRYSSSYLEEQLVSSYNRRHPDQELTQLKMKSREGDGAPRFFYANRLFRVIFTNSSIAFNIVSAYPGWVTYLGWIDDFLSTGLELNYKGVLLMYISEYRNIHIFDEHVLDGNVILNHVPEFAGTELQYKCNLHDFNNHGVIGTANVKLTNAEIIQGMEGDKSRIEITVSSTQINGNHDSLIEMMGKLHKHEKNLFYAMLNEEFVNTLNPVYE